MRRLMVAGALLAAAVGGGLGLALAAGGKHERRAVNRSVLAADPCFGASHTMLRLVVRVPAGVREASALASDGSSTQARAAGGAATFLLPASAPSAWRPNRLAYLDARGRRHDERLDLARFAHRVCPPPGKVSVGRRVGGPGDVELVARPVNAAGPHLAADVCPKGTTLCLRAGRGPFTQHCMPTAYLPHQDGLQGWAYRLPHGVTVLGGVVDRAAVRAVRVRRHGWPSRTGLTLPVSRSGAFLLAEAERFADGATWELRPVYRTAHRPVMRLVGIGPVTGGPPATRIAQAMLDHYAVLRRTREPKDELPPAGRGHRPQRPGGGRFDVNPAFSRLVADRYGVKVWLVPGRHGVCVVQTLPRGGGAGACGPASFAGYYTGHEPLGMGTVGPQRGRADGALVFVLLPDDSSAARLERHGKVTQPLTIADNAVLVRTVGADAISWLAPDGSRRRMSIEGTEARRTASRRRALSHAAPPRRRAARPAPSQGRCPRPAPDPLSSDAITQASAAARRQAPIVYPGTNLKGLRVSKAVLATADDPGRGGYARIKCGRRVQARTVVVYLTFPAMRPSASLSQGVVLVSRIRGDYRVWARLH